ncbi:hypothetical protein DdX_09181 [Ditylenchus destructor]|uniref:Uncharacterized protein n=1 Tax=Ditylenchus destructor TaxID=166010 RepID=A0AAD4N193_9BILA|nr:hypothetical protein DdX_09181 [Ditylenchus destructor]
MRIYKEVHLISSILLLIHVQLLESKSHVKRSQSNIDVDALKENVKEVLSLTGTTIDGLEKLRLITEKSAILMSFINPAGSIIATGIATVLKDDPEELVEIRRLHTNMMKRFDTLENELSTLTTMVEYAPILSEYHQVVSWGINELEKPFSSTINDQPREPYREMFINACKSTLRQNSPRLMLQHIKTLVVDECQKLPTTHESFVYAESLSVFENLERVLSSSTNLAISSNDDYSKIQTFLNDKIGYSNAMSIFLLYGDGMEYFDYSIYLENLQKKVRRLERAVASDDINNVVKLLEHIANVITDGTGNTTIIEQCLPKAVAHLNRYRRSALINLASVVATDVVRLVEMSGLCISLTFRPEDREKEFDDLQLTAELIASSLNDYILFKLDSAWPLTIEKYIKDSIETDVTDVNSESAYRPIAQKIKHMVDERSFDDKTKIAYHNQVLVMEGWSGENLFYSTCTSGTSKCIIIQNYHLLNIIVARHKIDLTTTLHKDNANLMNNWINLNEGKVKELILRKQAVQPLGDFLRAIRAECDFRAFRSGTIIVVRKYFWIDTSTIINVGMATSSIAGFNETAVIEKFCPHYFPDPVDHIRVKIFFFV